MNSSTGVFVGTMTDSEWCTSRQRVSERTGEGLTAFAGNAAGPAALSGRISFVLGLKGPCVSVATVCSSSLVATNGAVQTLQLGRCSSALVAAVNIITDPVTFLMYGGALAPNGHCKTFDAAANGLGRGDAAGAITLDCTKHRNVQVSGCAVNQDGRSASMAAPNGPAQMDVLQSALSQGGGVTAMQHSESHGTGTSLGDPIEVGALNTVFGRNWKASLVIGALKSRLGHTEGAAGVMGVIKSVMVLKERCGSPNLKLRQLNLKIDLDELPAVLSSALSSLTVIENTFELASGVSSFGITGTNAFASIMVQSPSHFWVSHEQAARYIATSFAWWLSTGNAWWNTRCSLPVSKQIIPAVGIAAIE